MLSRVAWGVMCAAALTLTAFTSGMAAEKDPPGDIVKIAVDNGSFKTLATALKEAELVGTLQGKGPFTVFAPNDDAFAKVPKDKLEALLKDKKALTGVLTYHVVPGKMLAADVIKEKKLKTVNGKELTISVKGDTVMIDGAKILKTDIIGSNGVIHVIDAVVIPKE